MQRRKRSQAGRNLRARRPASRRAGGAELHAARAAPRQRSGCRAGQPSRLQRLLLTRWGRRVALHAQLPFSACHAASLLPLLAVQLAPCLTVPLTTCMSVDSRTSSASNHGRAGQGRRPGPAHRPSPGSARAGSPEAGAGCPRSAAREHRGTGAGAGAGRGPTCAPPDCTRASCAPDRSTGTPLLRHSTGGQPTGLCLVCPLPEPVLGCRPCRGPAALRRC